MLVKCPECHKKISSQAESCPHCGHPMKKSSPQQESQAQQSALAAKKPKKHGFLFIFGIFLAICFCLGMVARVTSQSPAETIYTQAGMTPEGEEAVKTALSECDIESVDTITHDEMLDNAHFEGEKGYRISSGDTKNIILYTNTDGSVYQLKYADNILFENGAAVSSIHDYTFTIAEISNLQVACEDAVESVLVAPATAKFPNYTEWGFSKQNGEIIIQGYVDSENAFGATLRSTFQFTLNASDNTVKSFIFDGQEMVQVSQ